MKNQKSNPKGKNAAQPYVAMLKPTLKEPAWKDLSYGARVLYITLKSFYNGENNGQIFLSARKAADEMGTTSLHSVVRWFRDLEDHGFIKKIDTGHLGSDGHGLATTWRLTELGYMRERPSREYQDWTAKKQNPVAKMATPEKQNPVAKMATVPLPKWVHPVAKMGTPVTKMGTGSDAKPPFLEGRPLPKWVHSTLPLYSNCVGCTPNGKTVVRDWLSGEPFNEEKDDD